jgi:hypothetical protein
VRTFLKPLVAAVAVAAVLCGAAAEASAQTFTKIVDIEAIGGFTAYQAKVSVWYQGSSGKGFVLHTKTFHDGTKLEETSQIPNAEVIDLWWAAYNARPWSAREVKNSFLNVDLPNTKVTYMDRWSQLIRADLGARSLPPVSAAMKTCTQKLWEAARKVDESDLFRYEASGGLAGMQETVVITQGGKITWDLAFARGGTSQHKEGNLSAADVNALKALCAGWFNLPAKFEWPQGMVVMDGIGYSGTYSWWGYTKKVGSKTAADEDPAYEAVLAKVSALKNAIQ